MTLLGDVVDVLTRERTPHALIGTAAMAVHGVSRSTADVELPAIGPEAGRLWARLHAET